MPISTPQIRGLQVAIKPGGKEGVASWPISMVTWFTEAWQAVFGWKKTYFGTLTHDFGNIGSQSQLNQTVTLDGARVGDSVKVTPTTAVNGIIIDGTVTADNTVTVRAINYTGGAIDPASQTYNILVFQQ